MVDMIEKVEIEGRLYAIIIHASFDGNDVHQITPEHLPLQLLYNRKKAGNSRNAVKLKKVNQTVITTQEFLIIKSGKLRVTLYDDLDAYITDRVLKTGDMLLLVSGGHGFEVLEEVEIIEVKQGPYTGESEKRRFKNLKRPLGAMLPLLMPYIEMIGIAC
jgi:hypothetical protein